MAGYPDHLSYGAPVSFSEVQVLATHEATMHELSNMFRYGWIVKVLL